MTYPLTWKLVDETAAALGAPGETRRKWRQTGRGVPFAWRIKLVEHLNDIGHDANFADFEALPETPGRIAA